MHKKDLWLRLKSYHFDHVVTPGLWDHVAAKFGNTNPSVKAFVRKIANKHGWSNHFTARALNEYKKFVYLGVVSHFPVTPSKVIDVVWHEHLLFSKAYRDFCNDVIEKQFDHNPELIPVDDQTSRYYEQYTRTIELYKTEFDLDPPEDIWYNTKFDKKAMQKQSSDSMGYAGDDSTPLYSYFESSPAAEYPEFSGYEGGDGGGGGAGGDWSDGGSDNGGDGGGGCSGGCGGGGD